MIVSTFPFKSKKKKKKKKRREAFLENETCQGLEKTEI